MNSAIAALDESVITGGDLGVTDVVVEDSTMNYTETHQQPRSVVFVRQPSFVEIRINGHDNVKALESGRQYVRTLPPPFCAVGNHATLCAWPPPRQDGRHRHRDRSEPVFMPHKAMQNNPWRHC